MKILDLKRLGVYKINPAREIILDRQEKVKKAFFLEHKTVHQIAKELNWHHQTIKHDIQILKKRFFRELKIEPIEQLLSEIRSQYELIEKECLKEIEMGSRAKFRYLEILKDTQTKKLEALEKLGLIEKIPEINITINKYEEDLERAREKWKQSALIKKKKSESLTPQ